MSYWSGIISDVSLDNDNTDDQECRDNDSNVPVIESVSGIVNKPENIVSNNIYNFDFHHQKFYPSQSTLSYSKDFLDEYSMDTQETIVAEKNPDEDMDFMPLELFPTYNPMMQNCHNGAVSFDLSSRLYITPQRFHKREEVEDLDQILPLAKPEDCFPKRRIKKKSEKSASHKIDSNKLNNVGINKSKSQFFSEKKVSKMSPPKCNSKPGLPLATSEKFRMRNPTKRKESVPESFLSILDGDLDPFAPVSQHFVYKPMFEPNLCPIPENHSVKTFCRSSPLMFLPFEDNDVLYRSRASAPGEISLKASSFFEVPIAAKPVCHKKRSSLLFCSNSSTVEALCRNPDCQYYHEAMASAYRTIEKEKPTGQKLCDTLNHEKKELPYRKNKSASDSKKQPSGNRKLPKNPPEMGGLSTSRMMANCNVDRKDKYKNRPSTPPTSRLKAQSANQGGEPKRNSSIKVKKGK